MRLFHNVDTDVVHLLGKKNRLNLVTIKDTRDPSVRFSDEVQMKVREYLPKIIPHCVAKLDPRVPKSITNFQKFLVQALNFPELRLVIASYIESK